MGSDLLDNGSQFKQQEQDSYLSTGQFSMNLLRHTPDSNTDLITIVRSILMDRDTYMLTSILSLIMLSGYLKKQPTGLTDIYLKTISSVKWLGRWVLRFGSVLGFNYAI